MNRCLITTLALLTPVVGLADDEPGGVQKKRAGNIPAEQVEFFEREVRPLLVKHCFECHSAKSKPLQGGLRLDTRAATRRGGESGAAVVPGKPDDSLLIAAVRRDGIEMPPKRKLLQREIRILERWVALGAPDPRVGGPSISAVAPSSPQARAWWAFRPFTTTVPQPTNDDWSRNRIDRFVLSRLQQARLTPSPRADRRSLVRRLSFDLTGLGPTPEQVDRFVADDAPGAYQRLITHLLASPAYGEHWGRFWLDKARYADALPGFESSTAGPWRYRDWVVDALNADTGYDDFISRQLATDLMAETGPDDLAALGFFGLSPSYWKELKLDISLVRETVAKELEERVDVFGRTFLGLTLACSRCHDHKFDPISNHDYYAIGGVLMSSRPVDRPLASDDVWLPIREAREQVRTLTVSLAKMREQLPKTAANKKRFKEIEAKIASTRKSAAFASNTVMVRAVEEASIHVVPDGPARNRIEFRRGQPRDLHVHIRGNPMRKGPVVPRRFLEVLTAGKLKPFQHGSGRLELARALFDDGHPLVARVIVNRIWEQHFGYGLVRTPSNFGTQGQRPSHPALLDDLASRFVAHDWSLKWLHREILSSATFQQSSRNRPDGVAHDPGNRLLWHFSPRRLAIEPWRDAMLQVTGSLDQRLGGPSGDLGNLKNSRRTLYGKIDRKTLNVILKMHDFPDPGTHSPRREPTTTPVQQLFAMNSPFLFQQADRLAGQIRTNRGQPTRSTIHNAYRMLFQRSPTDDELSIGETFLETGQSTDVKKSDARWSQYLHALLASNEFLFVD
mgnify:FL=1